MEETIGLRERKRVETRSRLERVTVEHVLRDGLQKATIDAICDEANVSPRTFFNYFDSKEDAVLGLPDFELADDAVIARAMEIPDGDVIVALIGLIMEFTSPSIANTGLRSARTEILQRYPELLGRQVARLTRMSDDLREVVLALMSRDPRFSNLAGAVSPLAEMILALCGTAVRTCAREWIAAGSGAPIDEIRSRAIALAEEAVERLHDRHPAQTSSR